MRPAVLVDIGNTTTRVGLWDGRAAREITVIGTGGVANLEVSPASLVAGIPEASHGWQGMAICSVVPEGTLEWQEWAKDNGLPVLVIDGTTPALVTNRYSDPKELGADRLAAAAAAVTRLGAPVITILLGTATVVDAVTSKRELLGGAIAVGVETGLTALAAAAVQLPRAPLLDPGDVIGPTTAHCLQAGAVIGTAALVEGLVRRMKRVVGEEAKVVLAGGNTPLVAPHLEGVEYEVFPDLVLQGTGVIWEHSRR